MLKKHLQFDLSIFHVIFFVNRCDVFISCVLPEDFDPIRFEPTTVAVDLVRPMEFDIAPDGKIFLIELAGEIKRIDPVTRAISLRRKAECNHRTGERPDRFGTRSKFLQRTIGFICSTHHLTS